MSIWRRRTRAALLLCAPLIAGCGTATRMDFASHSRPASPDEVSVYFGPSDLLLDPRRIAPGPVQFDVTNQSGRPARLALTLGSGRQVASTATIEPGGTAQLKADLHASRYGVSARARGAATERVAFATLLLSGRRRTGDDALLQP